MNLVGIGNELTLQIPYNEVEELIACKKERVDELAIKLVKYKTWYEDREKDLARRLIQQ